MTTIGSSLLPAGRRHMEGSPRWRARRRLFCLPVLLDCRLRGGASDSLRLLRRGRLGKWMLLAALCLGLTACSSGRRMLPEGTGLLPDSAVQEADSSASGTAADGPPSWERSGSSIPQPSETASQPAVLSISDFSPEVLTVQVGEQAECTLSILPTGLKQEQLTILNDNPDAVKITVLSLAEEGEGKLLRLRLAFVGAGVAGITVQSSDGQVCSNTLRLEIAQREESTAVYITSSGSKFHYSAACGGKNAFETTLSQAVQEGYTPCKRCAG